eukprot:14524290-Ditylum_brightwellii.AAC.1
MEELAEKILPHRCNPRCLAHVGENEYCCRKLNNVLVSKDNMKHTFKMLPNELLKECLERLICIGIIEPVDVIESGYE